MKFAFVFPGQGSQSIGMMNGYTDLPIVQETFQEASDILKQDFWSMVNSGPAEDLNLTINTQPLMLIAGIAVYRAWNSLGGSQPALLAGHSLGEYTALVAADVISFADALALVRFRAQAMQHAVPEGIGGMAAILESTCVPLGNSRRCLRDFKFFSNSGSISISKREFKRHPIFNFV